MEKEDVIIEEEGVFASNQQLRALHHFKIDALCRDYAAARGFWIKNNLCSCVDNMQKGDVIDCKHVQKELKAIYNKEEKKIWVLTTAILGSSVDTEL